MRARPGLEPILLAVALLLTWEAYARLSGVPFTILPSPSRIATSSLQSALVLLENAGQTFLESLLGFVLAVTVAVVFALGIDLSGTVRRAVLPLLVVSQTIPIVALAPLLALWFGFGLFPKVLVVALVCFFPMVVAAAGGLASTDPDTIALYRTFGASRLQIFVRLRVPTALPQFFSGVRIAITYSVIGAIFGEYAGAFNGLGVFLQTAKNSYRTDLVFGAIVLIAALSLTMFGAVSLVERAVAPWSRQPEEWALTVTRSAHSSRLSTR